MSEEEYAELFMEASEEALQEELAHINAKLAELTPKVEQDIRESRERHRKLWNY